MLILIVDDEQDRHILFGRKLSDHQVDHSYNYANAVHMIRSYAGWHRKYDVIYLDHDLGGDRDERGHELTGVDVAEYLVHETPKECWPDRVVVHSLNPVGAKNIMRVLIRAGIKTDREPFNV